MRRSTPFRISPAILAFFCLAVLDVGGSSLGAVEGDEVQFVAMEAANGLESELSKVLQGPLAKWPIATVSGKTAHLVVCGGLAYWAVNEPTGTRLYRSRFGQAGLNPVASYPGASVDLKTDGRVVFWSVATSTGGSLFYVSNRLSNAEYVTGITGTPKALMVVNQTAFWAFDGGSGDVRTAVVTRFRKGDSPATILSVPNSRINGMSADGGHVWALITRSLSPTMAELYQCALEDSSATRASNVPGTGRQIAASSGFVFWSVDPPSGGARLYSKGFDGGVESYPPTNIESSVGVELTGDHGVWWGTAGSATRVYSFDLSSSSFLSNSLFPGLSVSGSVRWEDEIWLALRPSSGSGSGVLASFVPSDNGFSPGGTIPRNSPVVSLAAGRWHLFDVSGGSLNARDSSAFEESLSGPFTQNAQMASGPAGLPDLPFAANSALAVRSLYGFNGGITQSASPGLDTGDAYSPKDLFVWNDQLWLTVRDSVRRLAAYRPAAGSSLNPVFEHVNPAGFRAFKGRLLFEEDSKVYVNGVVGRRNVVRSRSGSVSYIGNPSLPSPSGLLLDYRGFAIFESWGGTPDLTAVSISSGTFPIAYAVDPSSDPDVKDLFGWKGSLIAHYKTAGGLRQLFSMRLPPPAPSVPLIQAEEFRSFASHRGRLYYVAKSGSTELISSLVRPDTPGSPPFNVTQMGLTNVRGLHSHGNTLYAVADDHSGPLVLAIRNGTLAGTFGVLPGFKDFRSFQGSLYAMTEGAGSDVFRLNGSSWVPIFATPLEDASDFVEHSGSLFFSARANGSRGLFRLAKKGVTLVSTGFSDFNPRSLTPFGDYLLMSGNSPSGRELFAFGDFFTGPKLEQSSGIGVEPQPANPFIPGPVNIRLSATSLVTNLPSGYVVGTLSADDEEAPFQFSILPVGNVGMTVDGTSVKLVQPSSSAFGFQITIPVKATNRLGISSVARLTLDIVDNHIAWITGLFSAQEVTDGLAEDLADPDRDGVVNLLERAFGTNPRNGPGDNDFAAAPQMTIADGLGNPNTQNLRLAFRTPEAFPSGMTYLIQGSDDLKSWTTLGSLSTFGNGEVSWSGNPSLLGSHWNEQARTREFEFRDSQDLHLVPMRFLRVRVQR